MLPEKLSRGFGVILILLTTLCLISIILAGYAYYNYKLKSPPLNKEEIIPLPSAKPSPSLSSEEASRAALLAKWNTLKTDCGFEMKYPKGWLVPNPYPGCPYIEGPNFTHFERAENYGQFIRFARVELGGEVVVLNSTQSARLKITSLEDQVKAWQLSRGTTITNIEDKTYGKLSGKQFTLINKTEEREYTNFIFIKSNFFYTIDWPNKYLDKYQDEIENMIYSISFL